MKIDKILCDNCGKEDWAGALHLSCGYGSSYDEEELDFCSDACLLNFIENTKLQIKNKGCWEFWVEHRKGEVLKK